MSAELSIAAQCYASTDAGDKLFECVNKILGCDTRGCSQPGFVWGATDTFWDAYDSSVEIVRPGDADWMERKQADAILALGFDCIFESIGEEARVWNRSGFYSGSPRSADENMRLRAQVKDLRLKIARLLS